MEAYLFEILSIAFALLFVVSILLIVNRIEGYRVLLEEYYVLLDLYVNKGEGICRDQKKKAEGVLSYLTTVTLNTNLTYDEKVFIANHISQFINSLIDQIQLNSDLNNDPKIDHLIDQIYQKENNLFGFKKTYNKLISSYNTWLKVIPGYYFSLYPKRLFDVK